MNRHANDIFPSYDEVEAAIPGSNNNIGVAFELLLEELSKTVDDIHRQGGEAFRERRYTDIEVALRQAKSLGNITKDLGALQEKALSLFETQVGPMEGKAVSLHSDAGLPVRMTHKGAQARGHFHNKRVTLSEGSTVCRATQESLQDAQRENRRCCESDGTLIDTDDPDLLKLAKPVSFASPSAAAEFVAGCSVSGNREWRLDNGKTLGDYVRGNHTERLANIDALIDELKI
jgi:hypothetical protein